MTIRTKSRTWLQLERILLLVGLLALGVWASSYIVPVIWQDWENWVFDSELRRQPASFGEYATVRIRNLQERLGLRDPQTEPEPARESGLPTPTYKENGVVGRLNIPRLELRGIVREGASEKTLSIALGHIPGTAFPGQSGSVGVAGHRDKLFRGLRGIQKDDRIQLETTAKNYTYNVVSTQIVRPNNVGVLQPANKQDPELTLVTCYPFDYIGAAPYRFIVKARQVGSSNSANVVEASQPAAPPVPNIPLRAARFENPAYNQASTRNSSTKGFTIAINHSQQLAPGISLGLTQTDVGNGRFSAWVWVMPDRHTVWLRNQKVNEAMFFTRDGVSHELRITKLTGAAIVGQLIGQPAE